MNEEFMRQIIAELIESQKQAFGQLTAAIAKQMDPAQLSDELRRGVAAAKHLGALLPLAEQMLTEAMAAADAETLLRRPPKH